MVCDSLLGAPGRSYRGLRAFDGSNVRVGVRDELGHKRCQTNWSSFRKKIKLYTLYCHTHTHTHTHNQMYKKAELKNKAITEDDTGKVNWFTHRKSLLRTLPSPFPLKEKLD